MLGLQHGYSFGLVDGRLPLSAAARVGRKRLAKFVCESEIINDQPTRLVLEDSIDSCNRLHQPVAAHRLVHIHRVERRHIESPEPHVADDDELQKAVLDGATVPIYYEGRLAKLALNDAEKPRLDEQFEEATEGEELPTSPSSGEVQAPTSGTSG